MAGWLFGHRATRRTTPVGLQAGRAGQAAATREAQPPDAAEEVTPRRVKHLIVIPGGADAGLDEGTAPAGVAPAGASGEAAAAELSPVSDAGPQRATIRIPFPTGAGVPGAATAPGAVMGTAAAQATAEALVLDADQPSSFKLKLKVISRSVTSPKAPGLPFIVLASMLVSVAVLGLVVLRVMVDQASFRVDDLGTKVTQQQSQLTQLRYGVSVQEAPDRLAAKAAGLGMIPANQVQPLPPIPAASTAARPTGTTATSPGTGRQPGAATGGSVAMGGSKARSG